MLYELPKCGPQPPQRLLLMTPECQMMMCYISNWRREGSCLHCLMTYSGRCTAAAGVVSDWGTKLS